MIELKRLRDDEEGSILVLFSASLFLLIFFAGIAIDLSMYYTKKTDLENLCKILREDRFTYQDTIRYSSNPGITCYNIMSDTMTENNFKGGITVYFKEDPYPALANYRKYHIRMEVSEEFEFHFLRLFGLTQVVVKAHIDGEQNYGDGGNDMIWHPSGSVSLYNGSYTGKPGLPHKFVSGDYPEGW